MAELAVVSEGRRSHHETRQGRAAGPVLLGAPASLGVRQRVLLAAIPGLASRRRPMSPSPLLSLSGILVRGVFAHLPDSFTVYVVVYLYQCGRHIMDVYCIGGSQVTHKLLRLGLWEPRRDASAPGLSPVVFLSASRLRGPEGRPRLSPRPRSGVSRVPAPGSAASPRGWALHSRTVLRNEGAGARRAGGPRGVPVSASSGRTRPVTRDLHARPPGVRAGGGRRAARVSPAHPERPL